MGATSEIWISESLKMNGRPEYGVSDLISSARPIQDAFYSAAQT